MQLHSRYMHHAGMMTFSNMVCHFQRLVFSMTLTYYCCANRSGRSTTLHIQNFKFLKEMGLKKPGFLPDFGKVNCFILPSNTSGGNGHPGRSSIISWFRACHQSEVLVQEKRKAVLDRFYTSFDAQVRPVLVFSSHPSPGTSAMGHKVWCYLLRLTRRHHTLPELSECGFADLRRASLRQL